MSRGILRRVVESREAVLARMDEPAFEPTDSFVHSGASSLICISAGDRRPRFWRLYLDRLSAKRRSLRKTSRRWPRWRELCL